MHLDTEKHREAASLAKLYLTHCIQRRIHPGRLSVAEVVEFLESTEPDRETFPTFSVHRLLAVISNLRGPVDGGNVNLEMHPEIRSCVSRVLERTEASSSSSAEQDPLFIAPSRNDEKITASSKGQESPSRPEQVDRGSVSAKKLGTSKQQQDGHPYSQV